MQAGKSQRSVLALVITCALILGFGIPLIPLVGVDSAEGTEVSAASDVATVSAASDVATVSAASDVATVSAENSLQNGSFEQPDVYQYRETSDVPYWKSTTTSGNIEIGSVFKNGNGDNDSLHMRTGEKVAAAEGSQFGKPATSNGNYVANCTSGSPPWSQGAIEIPMVPEAQGGRARTPWRWWSARNRTWPP